VKAVGIHAVPGVYGHSRVRSNQLSEVNSGRPV
jgi:hypothetical protein